MLQKTKGIVINYVKYKESSIIVRIYTEKLGLQSYIVNGVRSAKSKNKIALYQPLTLLDLVVYYKKNLQKINRISEVKCYYPFISIPFDFKKTAIALFITEVLHKTLKEETSDERLFSFLATSVQFFDQLETGYENFHLFFLIKLMRFLGFEVQTADEIFAQIEEYKPIFIEDTYREELKQQINFLIRHRIEKLITVSSKNRSEIIDYLLEFYRLHVANFDQIKSLIVLREMGR